MVQYIDHIIIRNRGDKPALVIMDNFKGQSTTEINELLEANDIHVSLLSPNTTDKLQPMDVSVNKPAKDFLKQRFEEWYASEVTKCSQVKMTLNPWTLNPLTCV